MRTRNLTIALLCLFVLVVVSAIPTKSQKPQEQADFDVIEIGTGADPQWSPDGKKISFLLDGWMYLANADGEEEIQKLFEIPKSAYRYHWLDSTEFLFQETEYMRDSEGKLLDVTNRLTGILLNGTKETIVESKQELSSPFYFSAPIFMRDGTVGYFQYPPGQSWTSENSIFKVIKYGRLNPDSSLKQLRAVVIPSIPNTNLGDIWLESLDKSIKKRITTGKLCSYPELSPDESNVLAICRHEDGIYVIDLQGNTTSVGEKAVDTADVSESSVGPKWSPDSKKIAYSRGTSKILDWDGQAIETIAAEIHIVNADGSGLNVIDIPNVIEFNPVWSPNGTKITCAGKNTGKVYVIDLK